MGVYGLLKYTTDCSLYHEVDMKEIANDFRSKNVGEPLIAVDGSQCAWYLYRNMDSIYGGQYKQFRKACKDFVRRFHGMGLRLSFFFDGLPVEEKVQTSVKRRVVKANDISKIFAKLQVARSHGDSDRVQARRILPAAVIPCAIVNLKELGCEVRLSTTDCDTELAQFAANNKCCIGVLSNDSDFLIYPGVPCLLRFPSLQMKREVTVWRFQPSEIASHLGLNTDDLPTLASFVGNDIVQKEDLQAPHKKLRQLYGQKNVFNLIAELVKRSPRGDLSTMCKVAFGDKWSDALEILQKSVRSYSYEVELPVTARNISNWDNVLQYVKAKHVSCEIPCYLLRVMKCRFIRFGDVLEDLSSNNPDCPPTGLVLRRMLGRMYTILLWESGTGPFRVVEYIPTGLGEVHPEVVEVQKTLPEGIHHPGLIELWSGPEDRRWRIFSWATSPTRDLSTLQLLSPQYLVVPAATLVYLYHEASILTLDEVRKFVIVAVSLKNFSSHWLSSLDVSIPENRAIYLSSLFVRTVLQILNLAGACGLSFPNPAHCYLDAYFDGKLFHHIYSKMLDSSNPREFMNWNNSCEETCRLAMNTIEQ